MEIEELIEEMQKAKADHPTLELQDILRMFTIKATQDLANEMRLMRVRR